MGKRGRRNGLLVLGGSVLLIGLVACSTSDSDDNTISESEAAKKAGSVIPASEETKNALGVVEWHVLSVDPVNRTFQLNGTDEQGQMQREISMQFEAAAPSGGTNVAVDVKKSDGASVGTFRIDDVESERAVETAPPSKEIIDVFTQLRNDIEHLQATQGTTTPTPTQLTVQSSSSSGSTGRLVTPVKNPIYDGPFCLLDPEGKPCAGVVLQTLGSGASTILGCASWLLTKAKLGGGMCAAGAAQTVGGMQQMIEVKCGARPCKQLKI